MMRAKIGFWVGFNFVKFTLVLKYWEGALAALPPPESPDTYN